MGFVMHCVAAPAARLERKNSWGVRTLDGATSAPPPALRDARARSALDLKKKKDAHEDAFPRRLGVRPR